MIYLGLAILSSCIVSICMRLSKEYTQNQVSLLLVNYAICTILAFVFVDIRAISYSSTSFYQCIGLSLISGFLYLFGFVSLKQSQIKNGLVMSSFFQRLGILIPTLLTIFVFKEIPSTTQVVGLVVAFVSVLLLQVGKRDSSMNGPIWLILLLISNGMADSMVKVFERVGEYTYQNVFLCLTFFFSFGLNLILYFLKKEKINAYDVLFGCLVGIPNFFSAKFILKALYALPAIYVYPINSVAVIFILSLIGVVFFREKINKKQWICFVGIAMALILLN